MTEEEKIKEEYRQYQLGTHGIGIWEEGAFRAGWLASKNFFKPDVIKSLPPTERLIDDDNYDVDQAFGFMNE